MKATAIVLLSLLAILVSCKTDGGSGNDKPLYYIMPLGLAYQWSYEVRDSLEGQTPFLDTLELIVIADTTINGQRWYVFNQSIPAVGLPTGLVSGKSAGLFARVDDFEYLLMKYPAIVSESWAPVDGCEIEVSADTMITVPAGDYDALTYRLTCEDSVEVVEASAAVDVGIVLIRHWQPGTDDLSRITDYRLLSLDLASDLSPGIPRRVF